MPRLCAVSPEFAATVSRQCGLATRRQCLDAGWTPRAIAHRLATGEWRAVLPSVYLTVRAEPTETHRSLAALLYAGPDAAIDGVDACLFYGLRSVRRADDDVHIVVPWKNKTRRIWYLDVRRTSAPITARDVGVLRYVDPATAAITQTRAMRSEREVLAVLSELLQRRMASYDELTRAHVRASPRNSALADDVLAELGSGVASLPENDFRRLVAASPSLPTPLYNCLLRLPCGRVVSPDALFKDAGLVHETNGRSAHEREDLFRDMQERHDVMTAAGLTVLHNPPRRLVTRGREAIAEVERCYERLAGRGLPPGVEVLRLAG